MDYLDASKRLLEDIASNDAVILARQLRLAVVTNVFRQGLLDESDAIEILSGSLSRDDASIFDDSDLLHDPVGLEKIANGIDFNNPKNSWGMGRK